MSSTNHLQNEDTSPEKHKCEAESEDFYVPPTQAMHQIKFNPLQHGKSKFNIKGISSPTDNILSPMTQKLINKKKLMSAKIEPKNLTSKLQAAVGED